MVDRPILFSGPMVNAILGNSKTQTRQVIKVPKWTNRSPEEFLRDEISGFWKTISTKSGTFKDLPTYKVGDRLWVRETWGCHWATDNQKPSDINPDIWSVRYAADNYIRPAKRDNSCLDLDQVRKNRPSIFMPRWASRLTLVVTDVRVQRLQEISEDDALTEGIEHDVWDQAAVAKDYRGNDDEWFIGWPDSAINPRHNVDHDKVYRRSFQSLWNSINDARGFGWDANPWVVAVTFEVHKCNIDQMEPKK